MLFVVMAVVFLLLLAAGMLAHRNSELISKQKQTGPAAGGSLLLYSVYNLSESGQVGDLNALPLFGLIGEQEDIAVTLCRVAAGKGEMLLADAQLYMLNRIRQTAAQGGPVRYEAFLEHAVNDGEKELIINLEQEAKEGANRANLH